MHAGPGPISVQRAAPPAALAAMAIAAGAAAGHAPALAVLGMLGAAFAGVVLLDLARGLALFAFASFAILPRYPSVAAAAAAMLGGAWLIDVARGGAGRRIPGSPEPRVLGLVIAFLLWSCLTALWSTQPDEAFTALQRLVPSVLLVVVAGSAVRSRHDAMLLVAAMVCGSLVAECAGMVAPSGGGSSADTMEGGARLSGFVGDPNKLAAMLLPAALLALGLAWALRGPASAMTRCLLSAAGATCAAGVLLTASRGALVATFVALLALVAFGGRWRGRVAAVSAAMLVAGVAWFAVFAPSGARDHLSEDDGGSGRTALWLVSTRMVADHPLEGVGLAGFRDASPRYVVRPGALRSDVILRTPRHAHNTYLEVAAEQGLVGLALLLALVGACVAAGMRAARLARRAGDEGLERLARVVVVAQAAVLAAAFFLTYTAAQPLWLILALGPALLSAVRRSA